VAESAVAVLCEARDEAAGDEDVVLDVHGLGGRHGGDRPAVNTWRSKDTVVSILKSKKKKNAYIYSSTTCMESMHIQNKK
jgi:hypothetical protein